MIINGFPKDLGLWRVQGRALALPFYIGQSLGWLVLQAVPSFQSLDVDSLAAIARASKGLEPHNGTVLFNRDDPGDSTYSSAGGVALVCVTATTLSSKALMVEVFQSGKIAMLSREPRTVHAGLAICGRH